ncbi:MAG: hypothetical protein ACRCWG_02600 [Sarcina sp.]
MINVTINKNKSIGQVVFIVEGQKTEPNILRNIFTNIFDYQYETAIRGKKYKQYNSKENPFSRVIVINAEESNLKFIEEGNEYLDSLFLSLINEYKLDITNSAIYYVFDRDCDSNTDCKLVLDLLTKLKNSRENDDYYMQGILLLSYPAIESFVLSNFDEESNEKLFSQGYELKRYLHESKYNYQKITEDNIINATKQLHLSLNAMGIDEYNLDDFYETNIKIFDFQEKFYAKNKKYKVLSLVLIALLDLQLIEVENKEK